MNRYALLLLLATACAKDTWPDGRYLYVQGDTAGITFDHVELFFGAHITNVLPNAIPAYTKPAGVTEELKRRIAVEASRVQAVADVPVGHVDLALPTALADRLGEYVLVIAYSGATPVGIGVREDFTAQPEEITRYEIDLEPYPNDATKFDRWGVDGDGPNCVRWQQGDEVVAIVRKDDQDCDGFADADTDCDAMTYCAGECSYGDVRPCTSDTMGCTLGACTNSRANGTASRTCVPAAEAPTCLPAGVCDAQCDFPTETERLACALDAAHGAHDFEFPVSSAQTLCDTPEPYTFFVDLPDGVACSAAAAVPGYYYVSNQLIPFTFEVTPIAPMPVDSVTVECEVRIVENIHPIGEAPAFENIVHFLLPIDSGTSAIIGLTPAPGACDPTMQPPIVVTVDATEVATCGP